MTASDQIDAFIAELPAWQRDMATRLRALIHEAAPAVTEAWKWSTPVFEVRGGVCAIGAFKSHMKVNFFKGASLPDPDGLFNAGCEDDAVDGLRGGGSDQRRGPAHARSGGRRPQPLKRR